MIEEASCGTLSLKLSVDLGAPLLTAHYTTETGEEIGNTEDTSDKAVVHHDEEAELVIEVSSVVTELSTTTATVATAALTASVTTTLTHSSHDSTGVRLWVEEGPPYARYEIRDDRHTKTHLKKENKGHEENHGIVLEYESKERKEGQ